MMPAHIRPRTQVVVDSIDRELELVTLRTREVLPIAGWHTQTEDHADKDEATFVTFHIPGVGWSFAILADFDEPGRS